MKEEQKIESLATFIKLHNKEIQKFTTNYIYFNTSFTNDQCDIYSFMTESFIQVLNRAANSPPADMIKNVLEIWFERHHFFLTTEGIRIIEEVLGKAIATFCDDVSVQHNIKKELHILLEIIFITLKTSNIKFVPEKSKSKKDSLIDILEILITHEGYQGIVHTLKKIEEKFSFKRSSYYSYIPETREVVGVFGEEMNKIKKLREPLLSQKPFTHTYHSKKALLIKDPRFFFEEDMIAAFQLSSVVIVPVYSHEEMFGWMVLDNIGEDCYQSSESLEYLEEIGRLLGVYINRIGYYEFTREPLLLSEREKDVLNLLGEGFDNKEIGLELLLSEHTVRDYISQLMYKLEARNRTHLVAVSLRKQFIK
ncbi:LuxR C-terminal-related transcriptional regulator [Paraliobacillus sp. JSM ZJ581]|uniref:LuxR C-terminal-related transcriptional regulator n=1 Tax=Paraliobacillus sp. JSM ZJ581 TaxID=3342118 RepID=UPI0035A97C68